MAEITPGDQISSPKYLKKKTRRIAPRQGAYITTKIAVKNKVCKHVERFCESINRSV